MCVSAYAYYRCTDEGNPCSVMTSSADTCRATLTDTGLPFPVRSVEPPVLPPTSRAVPVPAETQEVPLDLCNPRLSVPPPPPRWTTPGVPTTNDTTATSAGKHSRLVVPTARRAVYACHRPVSCPSVCVCHKSEF